jgi:hypothetical protein
VLLTSAALDCRVSLLSRFPVVSESGRREHRAEYFDSEMDGEASRHHDSSTSGAAAAAAAASHAPAPKGGEIEDGDADDGSGAGEGTKRMRLWDHAGNGAVAASTTGSSAVGSGVGSVE